MAASVMAVISPGWLKWVWSTTSLCSLRPLRDDLGERVDHSSSVRIFCGITARPLVAKRIRRTCGMSSRRLPILRICSASSW